jgi:hypothetical protein
LCFYCIGGAPHALSNSIAPRRCQLERHSWCASVSSVSLDISEDVINLQEEKTRAVKEGIQRLYFDRQTKALSNRIGSSSLLDQQEKGLQDRNYCYKRQEDGCTGLASAEQE